MFQTYRARSVSVSANCLESVNRVSDWLVGHSDCYQSVIFDIWEQ
jgi:hypothetical protein